MCGVVGLLVRDPALEPDLGRLLTPMVGALAERGPDSSGVAVYSAPGRGVPGLRRPSESDDGNVVRLSLGSDEMVAWTALVEGLSPTLGYTGAAVAFPSGAVVEVEAPEIGRVIEYLSAYPAVRMIGRGQRLVVAKSTGDPRQSCADLGLSDWSGYMAVAHTRMATESAVTLLHSHPFVPDPDLCVVHNGSFSNYASVRRSLMRRGIVFDSDNDSEVGARLLAERLAMGDDLEEATRWIMKELDGFFTLVVTTADAMSVVRDAFACKPAVVAETAEWVAVASEYRALTHLPGIAHANVFEPKPEEVYTWTR